MKFEGAPQFNPEEKSQERLQAQAEIFADKGVENFSEDQAQILKYSSELSQIKDLKNLPPDLPEELVSLIQKHKDAYVNFLRRERKLETSFIEENIETYKEKFQPVIAELKAKMAQGNFKELPEYLGSGSNGSAFRIEVDGNAVVVPARYAYSHSASVGKRNPVTELNPPAAAIMFQETRSTGLVVSAE